MAYDRLEPIGDRRFDILFAQLNAIVWNAARLQYSKMEALSADDFLVEWNKSAEDVEEVRRASLADRIKAAFGR